jgi:hypothetical protein
MNLYMLYNPMWVMVLPNHALYSLGNEPVSISIPEAGLPALTTKREPRPL